MTVLQYIRSANRRIVLDVADKHVRRIAGIIVSAAKAGRRALNIQVLEEAFRFGSLHMIEAALLPALAVWEASMRRGLEIALLKALNESGRTLGNSFRVPRTAIAKSRRPIISFERANRLSIDWARLHSSELVVQIGIQTRTAIHSVMAQAFLEGLPPREAAELIRPLIGLDVARAVAVTALRDRMNDPTNFGKTIKAGKTLISIPHEGPSDALIRTRAEQYADRLLKQRSVAIARTETMAASNQGQRELWQQAKASGLLRSNQVRQWIVTDDERLCVLCDSLDGEQAPIDGKFESDDGPIDGPPAHPNCRCVEKLAKADEEEEIIAASGGGNPCHDPDTGQFCETEGGGDPVSRAFSSAPDSTKGSAKWIKENQELYDSNPQFKAVVDGITQYTQGDHQAFYQVGTKLETGDYSLEEVSAQAVKGFEQNSPLNEVFPFGEIKTFFEGQINSSGFRDSVEGINKALKDAPPVAEMHRGLMGPRAFNSLSDLKEGDDFHITGPTSFTSDRNIADNFSRGKAPGQRADKNTPRTIVTIRGGRGLKVSALSPWKQKEIISSGRFRVVSNTAGESEDRLADFRHIILEPK